MKGAQLWAEARVEWVHARRQCRGDGRRSRCRQGCSQRVGCGDELHRCLRPAMRGGQQRGILHQQRDRPSVAVVDVGGERGRPAIRTGADIVGFGTEAYRKLTIK